MEQPEIGLERESSDKSFDSNVSRLCKESDFDILNYFCSPFGGELLNSIFGINLCPTIKHRKNWEWDFIFYILNRNGMLTEGKIGLGFAVGKEPLPALFASRGCTIIASDYWDEQENMWIKTQQNAAGDLAELNKNGLCSDVIFYKNVTMRKIDMNDLDKITEKVDFCWSSCAAEHLGSIDNGLKFLMKNVDLLNPGGIAVHTVEFNLSSDIDTVSEGDTVVFRKCDIKKLERELQKKGFEVVCDFTRGGLEGDRFVDTLPYYTTNPKYHLHLNIGGYECTSYGLVVKRPL